MRRRAELVAGLAGAAVAASCLASPNPAEAEYRPARGVERHANCSPWNWPVICDITAVLDDSCRVWCGDPIAGMEVEMAQKVTVALDDDPEGARRDETVRSGLAMPGRGADA